MMKSVKVIGRTALLILLLPLCAGCATATKIESAKDGNYNKTPQTVLVFLPPGLNLATTNGNHQFVIPSKGEAVMGEGFDEVFLPFAAGCHIVAHTNIESKQDGKVQQPSALIASNNPDWVMTVVATKGIATQQTIYGSPVGMPQSVSMTYNVTIADRTENKNVWRANVDVSMRQSLFSSDDDKQPGRNAAIAIIGQMQKGRASGFMSCLAEIRQ